MSTAVDLKTLKEGERVRFPKEHWQPITNFEMVVSAGSTGVVTFIDPDPFCGYVAIKLDKHEPELDDWDNEVQVSFDVDAEVERIAAVA